MFILKQVWKKWLKTAHTIGNFQARVVLTLFYITALSIVGIFIRFFKDPLNLRKFKDQNMKSNFTQWEYKNTNIENAKKPY